MFVQKGKTWCMQKEKNYTKVVLEILKRGIHRTLFLSLTPFFRRSVSHNILHAVFFCFVVITFNSSKIRWASVTRVTEFIFLYYQQNQLASGKKLNFRQNLIHSTIYGLQFCDLHQISRVFSPSATFYLAHFTSAYWNTIRFSVCC